MPALDTVLAGIAGLMNGIYLPAATPASVAAGLVAVPCLLALAWLGRRLMARQGADASTGSQLDAIHQRLQATELLLADATSEAAQLRQRVDQLTSRQDALSTGNTRSGLRQAIALSRHGATTRQLVDTCGLSQGEAHLVQTLYGRAAGEGQPGEIH
ncbi:MAG: DUF2802 domain-containing protein [Chromatiales bacterium]|nr:DUF2802 domain-containing protein [Chromatiales bacterium]